MPKIEGPFPLQTDPPNESAYVLKLSYGSGQAKPEHCNNNIKLNTAHISELLLLTEASVDTASFEL